MIGYEPREDPTSQPAEHKVSLADQLFLLPTVLSTIVAFAAVIAVAHDISYFWYVNIDFLAILTTSDFIMSVASWLPLVMVSSVFPLAVNSALGKSTPFLSIYIMERNLNTQTFVKLWNAIRRNIPSMLLFATFSYVMIFHVSYQYSIAFFIFLIIILLVARRVNKLLIKKSPAVKSKYALSFFIITLGFAVGLLFGWTDGAADLGKTSPAYKIRTEGIDFPIVIVLRTGEKGVIYKQGDIVGFLPWDNIKGLSRLVAQPRRVTLPSAIYQWMTNTPPPIP